MRSQKKIFRLFSRLNVGGPSLHVVNLSVGLKAYGFDTTLVVGTPCLSEGSMEYYAHERKANLLTIKTFIAPISPIKDFITFCRLVYLFLTERPEIVHTHTFKAGLLGRLAAFVARVPVVVHTYHGHLLTGYRSSWKTRPLIWVETFLALLSDRLICVSPQVARDLIKAGISDPSKFNIIELGFDMAGLLKNLAQPSTLREELNILPTDKVVGIVGRLVPIKSVELCLEAMAPLLQDKKLHLVIIGDGSERAALEKIAKELKLSPTQVHFCGWRIPVHQDLKALDVCVCSSKNEGTSVSIIEAIVAGVPVVSTNVGGMGDLLAQGRLGQLVDYDAHSLRQGISHVLSDPLARERAKAASEEFQVRFSDKRLIADIYQVYSELQVKQDQVLGKVTL